MTEFDRRRRKMLMGMIAAPALPAILTACTRQDAEDSSHPPESSAPEPAPDPTPTPTPVPPADKAARDELAARITRIGENFGGEMGIGVQDVESGWRTGFNADAFLPQQSVSKLWVAITLLSQVDKGQFDLWQPITITRHDLTLFHQPIRSKVLRNGSYTLTAEALIEQALTKSDNTANDALLNAIGGPDAVRQMLAAKKINGVRFGPGERLMQSRIAGLQWDQNYAIENRFFDARDKVPDQRRKAAFEAYLADPVDGAKPAAIADALARLAAGKLLSPKSTSFLIDTLKNTSSGPRRLKGGTSGGWSVAHKTGTGQFYGNEQSGYNDVGIAFSPDGRAYGMAVQIGRTTKPTIARMEMMQQVTRAVIDFEQARKSAAAAGAEETETAA